MEYIVFTTWEHKSGLDENEWQKMVEMIKSPGGPVYSTSLNPQQKLPDEATITWFQIDEKTHGSVVKFTSKEEYDNYTKTMSEYRNISNVLSDVEMTSELKGHVRVKIKGKNVEYIE